MEFLDIKQFKSNPKKIRNKPINWVIANFGLLFYFII